MNALRTPLVASGLVLLLVGVGNLWVAEGNVEKYRSILAERAFEAPPPPSSDFPNLDARRTADVLRPLRHGSGGDLHAVYKLEFYCVVEFGGMAMSSAGIALTGIGLLVAWRRRRATVVPATQA